jgi:hypothetical protein
VRRQQLTLSRKDSLMPTMGSEGLLVAPKSHQGRTIAVFTSGGDSQGKRVCKLTNVHRAQA